MKIAVIMGGISSEREVSLNSGKEVFKNLDRNKYEVIDIVLNSKSDIFTKITDDIDFAFLALHGKFGEDGCIQSILDTMDIPYSGCNPLTSGILMDKNITKKLLKESNLPTSDWLVVKSVDDINYDEIDKMGYPVFIKPNSGGSSVATFFVHTKEEVENAVAEGLKVDEIVMIEKFAPGKEYTSFILNGEVFPTILIESSGEFFDYNSKYAQNGALEEVVYLDESLQKRVKEISSKCWDIFNCKAYVRVDMIIDDNNNINVLELNTLPGMTSTSLIPRSAAARGLSFSDLLDKIVEYSLKK